MKNITHYLINESFNNDELEAIITSIANTLLPEEDKLSFNVGLTVNLSEEIDNSKLDIDTVINRSIGHIVEGVIKAAFPNKIECVSGSKDLTITSTASKSSYDLDINGNKFEIKAAKNGKFDSINVSKDERDVVDYLLIVDYSYNGGGKVVVSDIYITNISGKTMTGKHMNKALHGNAVHYKQ